jgi:hypothetical protein
MATWGLLIHTDGTIEPVTQQDARSVALNRIAGSLDVVTVSHPRIRVDEQPIHVMYVDDWGMTSGLPINRKAWALYGRSPIHGDALLKRDDEEGPLGQDVIALVLDPGFPGEAIDKLMDAWLEANDYEEGHDE